MIDEPTIEVSACIVLNLLGNFYDKFYENSHVVWSHDQSSEKHYLYAVFVMKMAEFIDISHLRKTNFKIPRLA